MCGIVGFNWEDAELVKRLTGSLKHRGPDSDGFFIDKGISLGHTRLSIIDLSSFGSQPMYNEDESIFITFNGEIYNFKDIRVHLENKGHKFRSDSDTEVIIHAYEEYGHDCVKYFNGMFAFAIYDSNKGELFLARDRLGIKPLYYLCKDGKFMFGSEMKVLMDNISKKINNDALNLYFSYNYITGPLTIFKDVWKLMPGSILVYDLKKQAIIKDERYWQASFSLKWNMTEREFIKRIRKELDDSVQKRLVADVPVGAFLSGGVDSSAIVATISKFKDDLHTFSVGFDREGYDESKYANIVSELYSTTHHKVDFSSKDVLKAIDELGYHYDEPFGNSSQIPTYLVSKVARKYVTVSLSGDGGDELFGGYERYLWFRWLYTYGKLPGIVHKLVPKAVDILNRIHGNHVLEKGGHWLSRSNCDDHEKYAMIMQSIDDDTRRKLIRKKCPDTSTVYGPHFRYPHYFDNVMNADINNYIPDDTLVKLDRAAMAVSLEGRVPFLDHSLVSFTTGIPTRYKILGHETKYILKKAFVGALPKQILYRKKQGFAVPMKEYFRDELKSYVEGFIPAWKNRGIFDMKFVEKILDRHQRKVFDHSPLLFSMIQLELFYRRWVDE